MKNGERILSYRDAIAEAHVQSMSDPAVFIMGVGVADSTGIFGSTKKVADKYAPKRVFSTPMSENTLTGAAVGAAAVGMRPVLVHARNDFLLLTLDQIANHAAKWRYMSGGKISTPIVVRAIIGRGWGQAAQHSQSLQSLFMHFPGLQVIMPSNAYDAKGLLLSAMKSNLSTVCLEHRWLYEKTMHVPEKMYTVPIGKGNVVREGKDVTIVAVSQMVYEAEKAATKLAKEGIECEIIDPRTLHPLDEDIILESVRKTGRLVVVDTSWTTCGASAEISAIVAEKAFTYLKAPVCRIGLPDAPTPCGFELEMAYYPNDITIENSVRSLVKFGKTKKESAEGDLKMAKPFSGAF